MHIHQIPFSQLHDYEQAMLEQRESAYDQDPYRVLRNKTKRLAEERGITEQQAETMLLDNSLDD